MICERLALALAGLEIGFGLNELLVDFRGIDFSEKFALADTAADIAVPLFQIAVGARVDRRFHVRLHGPGKDQPSSGGSLVGWMTATVGTICVLGFLGQCLILRAPLQKCERANYNQNNRPRKSETCQTGGSSRLGLIVSFRCHGMLYLSSPLQNPNVQNSFVGAAWKISGACRELFPAPFQTARESSRTRTAQKTASRTSRKSARR